MKTKQFIISLLLPLFFLSCNFINSNNENDNISDFPNYDASKDLLWSIDIDSYTSNTDAVLLNNNIYLVESNALTESEVRNLSIKKINPENGEIIWNTSKVKGSDITTPLIINNYVFIQSAKGIMYIFDDTNGNLKATIHLSPDGHSIQSKAKYLQTDNRYIYWNYGYSYPINEHNDYKEVYGIAKFDINKIDFSIDPESPQLIIPENIYDKHYILTNLYYHNNTIYFIAYQQFNDETLQYEDNYIGALDLNTNTEKWIKTYSDIEGVNRGESFFIENNKLFMFDDINGCYNPENGETLYEVNESQKNIKKQMRNICSWLATSVYSYDNYFYLTTIAANSTASQLGTSPKIIKNVIALNKSDFSVAWSDFIPNCGSMGTRPIVIKDKCYVLNAIGLYVYNAKTGKRLGNDPNYENFSFARNIVFNDCFIFESRNHETGVSKLNCLKVQ